MRLPIVLTCLLVSLLGPPATAYAEVVTYRFKGIVEEPAGVFVGQVDVGSEISGTFSFDDRLVDLYPGDASRDWFNNDVPAANQPLTSSFHATVNFGSFSYTINPTDPQEQNGSLAVLDGVCEPPRSCDALEFWFSHAGGQRADTWLRLIVLDDVTGSSADGIAPGDFNLTDSIKDTVSILDHLDFAKFNRSRGWSGFNNGRGNHLVFTWTGLSVDPTTLLQRLLNAVTGVGPGQSLANKITLAQIYYAVPDVQATCAVLGDFARQVQAQRGKKLPAVQADQLLADASDLVLALGCE